MMEFKNKGMGELTEDGVDLSFTVFEASDGVRLTAIHREFDSPLRAREQFDKEVAKARKIIERGKKTDSAGKVVGERAQIIARSSGRGKTVPAVLWTDGPHFYEIVSNSVQDILELEKRYSN